MTTLYARLDRVNRMQTRMRRDAGVVERGGLENRCAFTSTQGSNPCLSATYFQAIMAVGKMSQERRGSA
jgi:hypothetical protein